MDEDEQEAARLLREAGADRAIDALATGAAGALGPLGPVASSEPMSAPGSTIELEPLTIAMPTRRDGASALGAPMSGAERPTVDPLPPAAATASDATPARRTQSARAALLGSPLARASTAAPASAGSEASKPARDTNGARDGQSIPSDGDIERERVLDAVRAPFGAIARGLQRAAGHNPERRQTGVERLEALRRQMLGDKRTARNEERQSALQEGQLAHQQRADSLAAQSAARRAQQRDAQIQLAQMAEERQGRTADAQASLSQSRAATADQTRARAAAMADPSSTESTQARQALRTLIGSAPESAGRRILEAAGGEEGLNALSAEELNTMAQRLPQYIYDETHGRRRGGGAGAGSAVRSAESERQREVFVQHLMDNGMPEAVARATVEATREDRLAGAFVTDALTSDRGRESSARIQERTESLRADPQVERLGRAVDSGLAWRQSLRSAGTVDPALLRSVFMSEALPPGFTPEQIQEARSIVNNLRGTLAQARSGAAVTEAEFDRITSEMGAAATSSPQAFQAWLRRQYENEGERAARIRARFGADVVSQYDSNLRREGAPADAAGSRGGFVAMRDANGRRVRVRAADVERAMSRGFERVSP